MLLLAFFWAFSRENGSSKKPLSTLPEKDASPVSLARFAWKCSSGIILSSEYKFIFNFITSAAADLVANCTCLLCEKLGKDAVTTELLC